MEPQTNSSPYPNWYFTIPKSKLKPRPQPFKDKTPEEIEAMLKLLASTTI